MALIDARWLRRPQFSETLVAQGQRQYAASSEILVLADAKDPTFASVKDDTTIWANLNGQQIPQLGQSAFVGDVELRVSTREFSYYKDNERSILVSIRYEAKPADEEPPQPEQPEFFRKFTFQTVQTTQPASESDNAVPVNSAGDPVDGLVEEVALVRATYTNARVLNPNFEALWSYVNTCNDAQFLGADAYTVRCTGISADFDPKQFVWSVSVEFTYKSDSWRIRYYDAGFNEIVNGKKFAILDAVGNPVSKPVALNVDGTAKAPGEPPGTIHISPYSTRNLNALFLTCGI